jgi:hypothetical protein
LFSDPLKTGIKLLFTLDVSLKRKLAEDAADNLKTPAKRRQIKLPSAERIADSARLKRKLDKMFDGSDLDDCNRLLKKQKIVLNITHTLGIIDIN